MTRGRILRSPPEALSLGFANTVAWRLSAAPEERLPSPAALLDWCLGAGVLDAAAAATLRARWRDRPREALAIHRRAVALREAIYALCRCRIRGDGAPRDALHVLNETLAAVPPRVRLEWAGHDFGWSTGTARRPAPRDLLALIAWSAADLLAGPRAHRMRQCADAKGCGWLFLDESRAGTRRWCSMGECGNRAKAHRHYLRRKQGEASATSSVQPAASRSSHPGETG